MPRGWRPVPTEDPRVEYAGPKGLTMTGLRVPGGFQVLYMPPVAPNVERALLAHERATRPGAGKRVSIEEAQDRLRAHGATEIYACLRFGERYVGWADWRVGFHAPGQLQAIEATGRTREEAFQALLAAVDARTA